MFKSDGILDYFKIDSKLFEDDKSNLKDNDIFILQFPNGNDLSFSYGKILSLKDNIILHWHHNELPLHAQPRRKVVDA